MSESLGDRMKANYEDRQRHYLTRRIPVIVRVDGRAFHTFTRRCVRPFDPVIMSTMTGAAIHLAEEMQGCKLVYIQSDEASFLLTDFDSLHTEGWFNYNQSKIESISASVFTAAFNDIYGSIVDDAEQANFDARAFNIPREEVANYFLWRAKDWERNSVSMFCRAFFSDKQMHGQGKADQHEMLHGIGKNWATDLDDRTRNGTFLNRYEGVFRQRCDVLPQFSEIDRLVSPWMKDITVPQRVNQPTIES